MCVRGHAPEALRPPLTLHLSFPLATNVQALLKRPVALAPISTTRTAFGDVEAKALCHGVSDTLEDTVAHLVAEAKSGKAGAGSLTWGRDGDRVGARYITRRPTASCRVMRVV